MLERIARLESDVEYIKRDIAEIKENTKELVQASTESRICTERMEVRLTVHADEAKASVENKLNQLATKDDLKEVQDSLQQTNESFLKLEKNFIVLKERSENFATKSDLEILRTEIHKTKAELLSSISGITRSIWIPLAIGLALWAIKIFFIK